MKAICHTLFFMVLLITACGDDQAGNTLRIINGKALQPEKYRETVWIEGCAATFIDAKTALTAAHCVYRKPRIWAFINHDFHYTESIAIHPQFSLNQRSGINKYDLAILTFLEPVAPASVPICDKTQTVGEMVGWGCNNNGETTEDCTGFGVKRLGYIGVTNIDEEMLEIAGQSATTDSSGYGASVAQGDSGGGVFHHGCLGGVISGRNKIGQTQYSYAVDLTNATSKDFLTAAGITEASFKKRSSISCSTQDDNTALTLYRDSGDCVQGRAETWSFFANSVKEGVNTGQVLNNCTGEPKAREERLSARRSDTPKTFLISSQESQMQWFQWYQKQTLVGPKWLKNITYDLSCDAAFTSNERLTLNKQIRDKEREIDALKRKMATTETAINNRSCGLMCWSYRASLARDYNLFKKHRAALASLEAKLKTVRKPVF